MGLIDKISEKLSDFRSSYISRLAISIPDSILWLREGKTREKTIKKLVGQLKRFDLDKVEGAAMALKGMGVPVLPSLLSDDYMPFLPSNRERWFDIVGKMNNPYEMEYLINWLKEEKDQTIRSGQIKEYLRRIGKPAVPFMIGALDSSDPKAKRILIRLLEDAGDSKAVPSLARMLYDASLDVESCAAEALCKLGLQDLELKDRVRALLIRAPCVRPLTSDENNLYMSRILEMEEDVAPLLIEHSRERRFQSSDMALLLLGKMKDKRAFQVLIDALRTYPDTRKTAAAALGLMGDKRAIEHLKPFLKDHEKVVRNQVLESLDDLNADFSDTESRVFSSLITGHLRKILEIGKPAIPFLARASLMYGFENVAKERAEKILSHSFSDRKEFYGLLNEWMSINSHPPLFLLEAYSDWLKEKAEPGKAPSFEELVSDLGHKDPLVRATTVMAVGKMKKKRAIALIKTHLYDEDRFVRIVSLSVLESISKTEEWLAHMDKKEVLRFIRQRLKDHPKNKEEALSTFHRWKEQKNKTTGSLKVDRNMRKPKQPPEKGKVRCLIN